MDQGLSLSQLAQGELEEKFQYALSKVLQNLVDVNTSVAKKRGINIKLEFEIDETRRDIDCTIHVETKLAPELPAKTNIGLFKDLATGVIQIEEYGSHLRGQAKLPDDAAAIDVFGAPQN